MEARKNISLYFCLFLVAELYLHGINGVGIGILEIPLKCYMRLTFGTGNQRLVRYHHNDSLRQCRPFIYKGQGGYSNNFKTLDECLKVCKAKKSPVTKPLEEEDVTTTTPAVTTRSPRSKTSKQEILNFFQRLIEEMSRKWNKKNDSK